MANVCFFLGSALVSTRRLSFSSFVCMVECCEFASGFYFLDHIPFSSSNHVGKRLRRFRIVCVILRRCREQVPTFDGEEKLRDGRREAWKAVLVGQVVKCYLHL